MNRFLILLILFFSFFVASAKEKQLTISKEKVELVITATTSEAQLKKIKKTLKETANIDFNFKDIVVNSKKQISVLTIEVDSNDGIKGSGTIIISNIYNVGFVRDYENRDTPLLIGNISEKEIELK